MACFFTCVQILTEFGADAPHRDSAYRQFFSGVPRLFSAATAEEERGEAKGEEKEDKKQRKRT